MISRTSCFDVVGVNEAGLPGAKHLGHFCRVEVLVRMLRVMRPEELGQLVARVLHEVD